VIQKMGIRTTGTDVHRVGINLVGELGLGAEGEDGRGHDGALEGRHVVQLSLEETLEMLEVLKREGRMIC
jgi:hypothetical protein